jgi:hypothetical protein
LASFVPVYSPFQKERPCDDVADPVSGTFLTPGLIWIRDYFFSHISWISDLANPYFITGFKGKGLKVMGNEKRVGGSGAGYCSKMVSDHGDRYLFNI